MPTLAAKRKLSSPAASKRGVLIADNIWRTSDGGAIIKLSRQVAGKRKYREEWIKPIDAAEAYCIGRRDAIAAELEALAAGEAAAPPPAVDDPRTLAGARVAWLAALVDPATGTLEAGSKRAAELADDSARWLKPFGEEKLAELTVDRLNRQARAWLTTPQPRARKIGSTVKPRPWSASTVNKARQALASIYDHAGLVNVADKMDRADEREFHTLSTLDRGFDPTLAAKILAALPDGPVGKPNPVKIRCRVMAATGLPPATIAAIQPGDLKLAGAVKSVYLRARVKGRRGAAPTWRPRKKKTGGGVEPRTLPLTAQGAAAFADFARANLFGSFDTRNMRRRFATAVGRAKRKHEHEHGAGSWTVPVDVRPYDLQHTFLTETYKQTGDERLVGHLAHHSEKSVMARRYTRSAVNPLAEAAIAKLSTALAVLDRPAAPVVPMPKGRRRRAS